MKRRTIIIGFFALCFMGFPLSAQNGKDVRSGGVYFVDGFHGGVYGHYPMQTYTDYMSDLLEKYPDWRMCLEIEPETWDTVMVKTPAAYARFSRWTESDRVEFTNPAYAQPYMYNISGESVIRQLSYGINRIHKHFPNVTFSTYAVEEPCFTSALPQILKQFGFRYASLKCPNTCWGGYSAPYGGELVNWIGPDGTAILTSPRYGCEALQDSSVWQTIAWGNSDAYVEACRQAGIKDMVGMCYQDAGWTFGPWIGYGDNVRNGSVYVTWKEYFEKITSGTADDDFRFSQEDVRSGLMWGSQVLQTIAGQVRRSENNLVAAEKAGLIAYLDNGFRYEQTDMDEAWRTLMLAQHHDSWIVPYNGLNSKGTWADNIALWTESSDNICNDIKAGVLGSFAGMSDEKPDAGSYSGGFAVRLLNTLGVSRQELVSVPLPAGFSANSVCVRDHTGNTVESALNIKDRTLSFYAEVPAFGYCVYAVAPTVSRKETRKSECHITTPDSLVVTKDGKVIMENDMYRIVMDSSRGGVITSLVAKNENDKEYVDGTSGLALNELRGFFYDEDAFRSSSDSPAVIRLVKDNGTQTAVISGEIASVPFEQTVVLKDGQARIDCSLRILWDKNRGIGKFAQKDAYANPHRAFYDDRYKLNVLFPLNLGKTELYKDAPFDVCKSSLDNTFYDRWDSIKHNVVLNWIDLEGEDGSLALLSDRTGSYSYGEDFPLALAVQFSGNGLWGRDYPIKYPTSISYAIIPHTGKWDKAGIYNDSRIWNEPLMTSVIPVEEPASVSYIDTGCSGYDISTAYPTDKGIVLRLFNASGNDSPSEISLGFPVKRIHETDLLGNITGEADTNVSGDSTVMTLSMPRFGIRTYLIEL